MFFAFNRRIIKGDWKKWRALSLLVGTTHQRGGLHVCKGTKNYEYFIYRFEILIQ